MLKYSKMRKTIIPIILLILLAGAANAEKYFVLDVNYIIGSVTFNSISLREIDRRVEHTDNAGFLVKTISFDNSEIGKAYYNLSENKKYLIYMPYSENAARIELYNPKNSIVMDISVSSFANTCGNKICEEHESYESCTKDCKSGSKDDFCDEASDGICDPDCSVKTDADCRNGEAKGNASIAAKQGFEEEQKSETQEINEKPNYLLWVLLVLAIVVIALSFLFIKKRKEGQTSNSLKEYVSENIRRGFTLQQIKEALYRGGYSEKEVDKAVKAV